MKIKMLLTLTASFAVMGCTTGGLTRQGDSRAISQSARQAAARQHPEIVAEFGGSAEPARAAYVERVGGKVAAQSGIQGGGSGAYTITTLNSPVLNAFAVPGGYVYVTRQLVGLMDDEAELASVLGHEIGHIAADHSSGRQNRGILTQLGALAVGILTGSGELAELAGTVGQGMFLSYSRGQEYEADALGIRYMSAAGYDAGASADLLASLGASETLDARIAGQDQRSVPSWARTHPLSEDRVQRATALASQIQRPGAGIRNRDQLLAAIDGMIWDDDPAQGVIRGNRFLHPDLRLEFAVPRGYGIQNGSSAVSITGSNGQAQFSGGSFSGGLSAYIGQVFQALAGGQGRINYPAPRTTTVNGIPAAYSTARASTQQGQLDVTVFAYQWDGNTVYHFAMITPAGSGLGPFGSMVDSLDRLSASEAASIRPRVIDVVTVGAGDTIQSLSNRMAYDDYKLERFLVLNSLEANSRLSPGSKVKLVVYGNR